MVGKHLGGGGNLPPAGHKLTEQTTCRQLSNRLMPLIKPQCYQLTEDPNKNKEIEIDEIAAEQRLCSGASLRLASSSEAA